jgi:hypothetical protein
MSGPPKEKEPGLRHRVPREETNGLEVSTTALSRRVNLLSSLLEKLIVAESESFRIWTESKSAPDLSNWLTAQNQLRITAELVNRKPENATPSVKPAKTRKTTAASQNYNRFLKLVEGGMSSFPEVRKTMRLKLHQLSSLSRKAERDGLIRRERGSFIWIGGDRTSAGDALVEMGEVIK